MPTLTQILLQLAAYYLAQAEQHNAAQDHPQTANVLGTLGTILSAALPVQPSALTALNGLSGILSGLPPLTPAVPAPAAPVTDPAKQQRIAAATAALKAALAS